MRDSESRTPANFPNSENGLIPTNTLYEVGGGDKIAIDAAPKNTPHVWAEESEKTVAWDTGKQTVWGGNTDKYPTNPEGQYDGVLPEMPQKSRDSRVCGLRKWTFLGILVGLILVVGLGAGLGGGLGAARAHQQSTSNDNPTSTSGPTATPSPTLTVAADVNPEYAIGGALNSTYYSGYGAWNGTGFARATGNSTTACFFQDYLGEIRYLVGAGFNVTHRTTDTQGLQTGITDAKNSTPISVIIYEVDQKSEWHLFYVDKNNQIREKWNYGDDEKFNDWHSGTLDREKLTIISGDLVTMGACGHGQTFNGTQVGMYLWYADENQIMQQYAYNWKENRWSHQYSFTGVNGHSGLACIIGSKNMRLFFSNSDQHLESWILEIPDKVVSGSPWKNMTLDWGSADAPLLHPSTSMWFLSDRIVAQAARDNVIYSFRLTDDDNDSSRLSISQEAAIVEATPGTHIGGDGWSDIWVFCQLPEAVPDIHVFQTNVDDSPRSWTGSTIFGY